MKATWNVVVAVALLLACACDGQEGAGDLSQRAYVVSELSDDLFVVDLATMSPVAQIDTGLGAGINFNHMAVLSTSGTKLYVVATGHDAIAVVDTQRLEVVKQIALGAYPTHASVCTACGSDGNDELWVVDEDDNGISIVDMERDVVVDSIRDPSMVVPHFVRFSNGRAYVPSIGGNQISVVDIATRTVVDVLVSEGAELGACDAGQQEHKLLDEGSPCGFADAQIDVNGFLMAAHIGSGSVMVYDTVARAPVANLAVGTVPWAVFVDPFAKQETSLMPNWGDRSVSIFDAVVGVELARSPEGDSESYGVNFSPLAPQQAFVMNRLRERVAVIDRRAGGLIDTIDVGGTTETASTTADGRLLLVPVSSRDALSVIDVASRTEIARFEDVGTYPWSVASIGGQNYCH